MHAGTSAWRDDGFLGRRMRRIFCIPPSRCGSARMSRPEAILRKVGESIDVKRQFFQENATRIGDMCQLMARRFVEGKKLFVMGNGGSACDALHIAVEFKHPIIEKRRPFPVEALMTDMATISAISN